MPKLSTRSDADSAATQRWWVERPALFLSGHHKIPDWGGERRRGAMGGRAGDEGTGFGERLKRLRVAAELTQAALAEQAGLNVFGVAIIEQGHRDPAWATVLALAETLNASPNDSQVQRPLPDTRPATAEPSPATQGKGKR